MKPSMNHPFAPSSPRASAISRRHFLRGAGIALSLPFLDSMLAPFARAAESASPLAPGRDAAPDVRHLQQSRRVAGAFLSRRAADAITRRRPISSCSKEHRDDFTVFSGVSHPNVDGGHPSDISFLTAAPHPASSSFRNTISLDQYIAERIGTFRRGFPRSRSR